MLARVIARLRGLVSRRAAVSELDEELQFHLAHEIDANLARGLPATEARRIALRDLGGLVQARESVREVRALPFDALWRDVRHAVRALRATPTFTMVALAVLALSVGASVAAFSIVDAVILRRLPFDRPDRLVAVREASRHQPDARAWDLLLAAPQNFYDWRERQDVFTSLAAAAYAEISVKAPADNVPENLPARRITANFFDVLRVAPLVGRPFTSDNEVAGREHVAVISYALWQRRFGGAGDVIGKKLPGQLATFEIVGVMPRSFSYPIEAGERVEVWVPFVPPPDARIRGNDYGYYLEVIGRLRDGVSLARAQARMDQITAELAAQTPRWFEDRTPKVERLQDYFTQGVRSWMLMLLGAVCCVLLMAIVNLANLVLARATVRVRELGIRAALGASRGALTRGLLVESLLLSLCGSALGTGVAWVALQVLRASLPPDLPRVAGIAIDLRVLEVTVLAAVFIGLTFGIAPVLQFVRPAAAGALAHGQRTGTPDSRSTWLRAALVVSEVALAMVLLVGSALFLTSFSRVASVDLGFNHRQVLTVQVRPMLGPRDREPGPAPLVRVLERVRALPGVELAALAGGGLPLRGDLHTQDFSIPGSTPPTEGDIALNEISPDYFRTLGIPLVRGRAFTEADGPGAPAVVILNWRAARMFFGGDAALGKVMSWKRSVGTRTVVGVVGDIRYDGPENDSRPQAFIPFTQSRTSAATLLLRTATGVEGLLPGIGQAVSAEFPAGSSPPVHLNVQTLERYFGNLVAQRRFNMLLLGLFGILGVSVASIGIYGVMAYLVAQRTHEIGIRMALGALPGAILWMVLARTACYVGLGLAAGSLAAWLLSTSVRGLLFDIQPHDPRVYLAVGGLLLAIGVVAALVPARRAASVDPLIALRFE